MTLQIQCGYPRQTGEELVADLMPQLQAWFDNARSHSECELKESPGGYTATEFFDTVWSVRGEPVMILLTFTINSETRTPDARCYIGSEDKVRTTALNLREHMKAPAGAYESTCP